MNEIKCYLDTNIISFIVKGDIHKEQREALIRIYSFYKQGLLDLYTSDLVKKELEGIPPEYKNQLNDAATIWMLLDKAKTFPTGYAMLSTFGGAPFGGVPIGGGINVNDPIYTKLVSIFDKVDAEHIFLCIKNNIPYFVTYDIHSILSRAKQHREVLEEFGIRILSPKEFENSLG